MQGRAYRENLGRNVTRNVIDEKRIFLLSNFFRKNAAYQLRITTYDMRMKTRIYFGDRLTIKIKDTTVI